MSKPNRYLSCMLFITIICLSSCEFRRLVKPEAQPVPATVANSHSINKLKFSYNIYDIYLGRKIYDQPAEKAFLDSFATFGVTDVVRSDNVMQDRTNIFVYIYKNLPDRKTSYIEPWWFFISLGTLCIVPFSGVQIYPVEIHLITPQKSSDKQIKIIGTEYAIENTEWLPYIFMPKDEIIHDSHALYQKYRARDERDYLSYTGFRRIFDRIIAESLKD